MPRVPVIPTQDPQPAPSGRFSAPQYIPRPTDLGAAARGPSPAEANIDRLAAIQQANERQEAENAADRAEFEDRAGVQEASNRLAEGLRVRVNAYRELVGKAAVGDAEKEANNGLGELARTLSDSLPNDRQKFLFRESAMARLRTARQAVDSHASDQRRNRNIGELDGAVANAQLDAPDAVGTDRLPALLQAAKTAANESATLQGWPEDSQLRRLKVLQATTGLHLNVVDSLMRTGRPDQARGYLEGVPQGEMDAVTRAKLQGQVRHASIAEESTRLAMEVEDELSRPAAEEAPKTKVLGIDMDVGSWDQQLRDAGQAPAVERPGRKWGVADAMKALDERYRAGKVTAEVRDATRERIAADVQVMAKAQAENKANLLVAGQKWLRENPFEPVSAMPAPLHGDLESNGVLDDIETFAKERRYSTNPKAFAAALDLPDASLRALSPSQLYSMLRPQLDDTDLRTIQAKQAHLLGTSKPDDDAILSLSERIKEGAAQAHILDRGRPMSDSQAQQFYAYQKALQKRVNEEQTLAGKKLNIDQLQQVIDNFNLDTATVDVWGWNNDVEKPVGMMTDAELRDAAYVPVGGENVYLKDIPQAQVQQATEALIRAGKPVTKRALAELWVWAGKPQ